MSNKEAADLVRRYKELRGLSQTAIAHLLSQALGREMNQKQVSLHMQGSSWTLDLPGAYVRALSIPADEMNAAWGFPEARPGPRPVTLADVVKNDPTLNKAAKAHLLNQYELLQLASLNGAVPPPPKTRPRKKAAGDR